MFACACVLISQGAAVAGSKCRVVVVKSEFTDQNELQIVLPGPEATMAKPMVA